jgi:CheY-like chemotaxis protein
MTGVGRSHRRFLIVDDNEGLASNIAAYLAELLGAEVAVVHSGEEAVLEAERFAPDCVVTDYHLPGIDGIETVTRIRAQDPRISAVLITGNPSEAIFAAARGEGMPHVLVKPFPLADLKGCLCA